MKVNWKLHFVSIFLVLIQTVMATMGVIPLVQIIILFVLLFINRNALVSITKKFLKR
jgi:hypothetical protein